VQIAPLQQSLWLSQGYSPPPSLQAQTSSMQYSLQQSSPSWDLVQEATPV
jgi:hypothetical protein